MHLLAVVFRIALYLVIAVLIAVNFHFYMIKRSDEARARNTQAPVQDASTSDSSAIPSQPLPPVEPLKPQTGEIIITRYDHSALAIKARESFLKKDYKTSAALCRQLAEKDAGAFLCVGLSHFMLGDYAASLTSFEKALEGRADEFTCRKYLAFAYYYVSNFEKSLFNAEKAVGIKKDSELEAFHARLLREKQAHLNFISESTKHFKIEYDGYEHGGISRTVIGMLEDAYSTIGRDLDYYPSEPITVILYTNHDFHDVTQSPGWVGGFFDKRDGKIRVPVRGAVGKEALLRIILFHEYVHALIYSITKNCPLWIHEGMAEYYSKGPSQKVGQLVPLNHLENSFAGLSGRGIAAAYMESHSAVTYLMDRYRPHRMKDLLLSLSKGNDMNRAFTDSFQISYTEFSDKWGK